MPVDNTAAVHAQTGDGGCIVGIGALRVLLIEEDSHWYAQGLEIDYVSQGKSIEESKKNFELGLTATIHENLRIHGTIEPVLAPAPVEIWKERLDPKAMAKRHSQISVHQIPTMQLAAAMLPFQTIDYLQTESHA